MRLFNTDFNGEVAREIQQQRASHPLDCPSRRVGPLLMNKAAWLDPRRWPALQGDEVHIWLVAVSAARAQLTTIGAVLSPEERERIARFRFEQHRERSQVARGLLRDLLARYVGRDAAALRFAYNKHGKPELPDDGVHFNTSHSGDFVVLAFTRVAPVGVDIEEVRGDVTHREQIAQRHFAPGEQQQLSQVDESQRVRAFFDLWTRKEAFVKARGDGLFSGLDQFETSLEQARLLNVQGAPAVNWWMSELPEVPGCAGAVVVNAARCVPRFWMWQAAIRP